MSYSRSFVYCLTLCILLPGCGKKEKNISSVELDTAVVDAKKKYYTEKRERIREENVEPLDTIKSTREEVYHSEELLHPLRPFELTYNEWKSIQCIISMSEKSYWDKYMIALIEKSGNLRISYRNRTIRLKPADNIKIAAGEWTGIFRNDSIQVKLSTNFVGGQNKRTMRGPGSLVATIGNRTFEEQAFFVYEDE